MLRAVRAYCSPILAFAIPVCELASRSAPFSQHLDKFYP